MPIDPLPPYGTVSTVEYRRLGRSGLCVSEITYGNWLTHGETVARETALACIRTALAAGITTFDTADVYAQGAAEEVLDEALRTVRRASVKIATKVCLPTGDGPNDRGLSRKHVMESCHASLRRLGTEYVDLYQAHGDPEGPEEPTTRVMMQGAVR
jgi:aryl-alcohol dehydrogenase-like predicted oxidoreductase